MTDPNRDEDWAELDDTLADGPAPAEVPAEAREWLAQQRTMHGLLRALHTADAASREGRVATILERIERDDLRQTRRRWSIVGVAAAALACFGVLWSLPESLPTAEAAMARTATELARDTDRQFQLDVIGHDRDGLETVHHRFNLVTRPGMQFCIDGEFKFKGFRVGEARVGCDGQQIWVLPANGRNRRSGPLSDRQRLLRGLGDVLDDGYLDMQQLVRKLPDDFDVRVAGRETDANGRSLLRITASRERINPVVKLRQVEMLVDEQSGMVIRLEGMVEFFGGAMRQVVLDYVGEVAPGSVDYRRPW